MAINYGSVMAEAEDCLIEGEPPFKIPPPGLIPRFGDLLNARHLYEVQTGGGWHIEVDANSRDQAERIARAQGYQVRSVNMIG